MTHHATNSTPLVSIGLPVYNGDAFLENAIESIRQQTCQDWELLIADNASSDRTEEIAKRFSEIDERIQYFRHSKNLGAVKNYNWIIGKSNAKYFKWAAHDDVLLPRYLEKTVELLEANPECSWAHGLTQKTDAAEQVNLANPFQKTFGDSHSLLPGKSSRTRVRRDHDEPWNRIASILLGTTWTSDISGVFRRECLDKTKLFLPYYGAEKTLLLEIAAQGKFAEVPEVLFLHRDRSAETRRDRLQNQAIWVDPSKANRWLMPSRLQLAILHFKAVCRQELPLRAKLLSLVQVIRYVFQFKKWPSATKRLLSELSSVSPSSRRRDGRQSKESGDTGVNVPAEPRT